MPKTETRPERRYRSLAAFVVAFLSPYVSASAAIAGHGRLFPCTTCRGKGWDYKEEDRDVVEGYKLAPRHKCGACNGTGVGTKEAVKTLYDQEVAKFKADLTTWKAQEALRRSGLKKLTPQEKRALGL